MDIPDDGAHDAFSIPDLWKPSIFTVEDEDPLRRPLHRFGMPSTPVRITNHLCAKGLGAKQSSVLEDIFSGVPVVGALQDLDTFQYGYLQDIPKAESATAPSELESLELDDDTELVDIWLSTLNDLSDDSAPVEKSWESFYDATFVEPAKYLSDLGSQAFDVVVAKTTSLPDTTGQKLRVFEQEPSLFALKSLGFGCSSWLFHAPSTHDGHVQRFHPMTISGVTPTLTQSFVSNISEIGMYCKDIRSFVDQCYEMKRPSSTRTALAAMLSNMLDRILFQMSDDAESARTMLEVHLAYQKPARVLTIISELTRLIKDDSSNMGILNTVFDFVCKSELTHLWARPLLLVVFDWTSRPWLDAMSRCLGLSNNSSCDRTLVSRIQSQAKDRAEGWDDSDDGNALPSFIPKHIANVMLETCNAITLLKQHHKGAEAWLIPGASETLKWNFSNSDSPANIEPIDRLSMDPYGVNGATVRINFEDMAAQMERLPSPSNRKESDELLEAMRISLAPETHDSISAFSCPLPLTPGISFANAVEKQHRLVGRECLKMLFRDYNIRKHLSLQRQYHLFGDGLFAARLSQALFSTNLSPINGRRDYSQAGDHGLRLTDRISWPPGGSELRLVLMGILNESYYGSYRAIGGAMQELPGNLSFGVRHLSDPEIEAIMDPHSLAALDFLRLQYTATSPLNTVLTEASLEKYDSVFKLLLRVSRLLAITSEMAPRRNQSENVTSARLRVFVTRFIEALSGYFLQSAIAQPWSRFEARLADLDASLDDDQSELGGRISSVLELRTAHDAMLDAVLFGLLLRHRQAPIMQLLEEIFTLILRFARLRSDPGNAEEIRELLDTFRNKVGTFVTVCRGLSGKKSYTAGATKDFVGQGEGSGIEQLVLRLNMNGWWAI